MGVHHQSRRHKTIAPRVRAAAYADPTYRCPHCRRTLAEARRDDPRIGWDAGHVVDGDDSSGYRAECSSCNRSRGAALGNSRKHPKTRNW